MSHVQQQQQQKEDRDAEWREDNEDQLRQQSLFGQRRRAEALYYADRLIAESAKETIAAKSVKPPILVQQLYPNDPLFRASSSSSS